MALEEAFCQLKSYMEIRPLYHWRPDRVRNHVRLCFIRLRSSVICTEDS
jgi:transposase